MSACVQLSADIQLATVDVLLEAEGRRQAGSVTVTCSHSESAIIIIIIIVIIIVTHYQPLQYQPGNDTGNRQLHLLTRDTFSSPFTLFTSIHYNYETAHKNPNNYIQLRIYLL